MPDCLQPSDKIAPGLRLHPYHLTMPEHLSQTPNPPNQSPQSHKIYFPLKTSTRNIHDFFKIEQVKPRAYSTARRFALSRQHHKQLKSDYTTFVKNRQTSDKNKHKTVFETIAELTPELHTQSQNIKA